MKSRAVFPFTGVLLFVSCASQNLPLQNEVQLKETYQGTYGLMVVEDDGVSSLDEKGQIQIEFVKTLQEQHMYAITGEMTLNGMYVYELKGQMDCREFESKACNLQFEATREHDVYRIQANVVGQQLLQGKMTGHNLLPPGDILFNYQIKAMRPSAVPIPL